MLQAICHIKRVRLEFCISYNAGFVFDNHSKWSLDDVTNSHATILFKVLYM